MNGGRDDVMPNVEHGEAMQQAVTMAPSGCRLLQFMAVGDQRSNEAWVP